MVSGFFSGSMTKALSAALVAAAAGLVTAVPVALAAPGPVATSLPTVSGTATVGQTLTATDGSWTGTSVYSYKWQRCENVTPSASSLGSTGDQPVSITVDSSGNVFTANQGNGSGNGSITRISAAGVPTTPWGSGFPPPPDFEPQGIAVDLTGNVYVTNPPTVPSNGGLFRRTSSGAISSLTGPGGGAPNGIAIDAEGNIFITSSLNATPSPFISKQDRDGNVINNPFQSPPEPWGGGSSLGGSSEPSGIAVDASGNVYVAMTGDSQIRRITATGLWNPSWATTALNPTDIAADNFSGYVYTANGLGGRSVSRARENEPVRSNWVTWPVGTLPTSIAVDSEGNVFVATDDNRVWKILPTSPAGSLAGGPWPISVGVGPTDIAVDPDGNVYTANQDSDSVTKITSSLDCTNIAGATNQSYLLTEADQDKRIRVKVTAIQVGGTANINSLATTPVAQAGGGSGGGSGGGGSGGGGGGSAPSVSVSSIKSKVSKKDAYITSRVRVSGAGRIDQRATTGSKKLATRCRVSKTTTAAGTQTLKCNLGSKGRKALKKSALKLTLRTGFTPTGGSAVFANKALTLKRKR